MSVSGPRISTIIAVCNKADTLQRCLESFFSQRYPHKELIVIDGASRDGTVKILEANQHRIAHWRSEPDRGIYHAWNKGLDHATGDWVHFLGADDYYFTPDVLGTMAARLDECDPCVGLAYGPVARVSAGGEVLHVWGEPWACAKRSLAKGIIPVPHLGVFHHKIVFETCGKFDETFLISGDYEFLLRALRSHVPVFFSDIVITAMTVGGVSTSGTNDLALFRENARARRLNDNRASPFSCCRNFAEAYVYDKLYRVIGERWAVHLRKAYSAVVGRPRIP